MSSLRFLVDLTTSRAYKGVNPVGIVRTEREIGKALLASNHEVEFFFFNPDTKEFLLISRHEATNILGETKDNETGFRSKCFDLKAPEVTPDIAEDSDLRLFLGRVSRCIVQRRDLNKLDGTSIPVVAKHLEFFDGDVLISAGLLWDGDYLKIIYTIKQKTRLFLAQIIYDIVPVLIPEFCVPGMNTRFPKFLLDAAWTADALYCISDSTLHDVDTFLQRHSLPVPGLHRIELGVDLVQQHEPTPKISNSLKPNDFIVYVSTIEPRKNHIMLFHVWRQLYQTDRDKLIPLVIVGRQGWNSSDLINMITAAEHLYPNYIQIMTDVSDAQLDWLYRNSRFTVYPSLYEGWGLPVAESLARGKFCITADTSSMPEVACGLAELIDPLDFAAWTKSVRHFLVTPQDILTREQNIRSSYTHVSWTAAMDKFVISITDVATKGQKDPTYGSEY